MRARDLDSLFRDALSAIDAGDLAALELLLSEYPRLALERLESPGGWLRSQIGQALDGFFKRPYLLWFVTEDAVRTNRLPPNVAAIARAIIDAARRAGAMNLQEQLDSTLHFAVCSPVGREDGLQLLLVDVLVDAGASMEGAPVQALICHNAAAARHLLRRGARLTLPAAACLDLWDDVARLGQAATAREKQAALALAALNGKPRGLAGLLALGVDVNAFSPEFYTHATPLHHAVSSGSLAAVEVLVEAGASLATRDKAHDGTPLGWAEYALTLPPGGQSGRQYTEIADFLRSKGSTQAGGSQTTGVVGA
jgi:peptide-methionine (S)-S-oxide reductase